MPVYKDIKIKDSRLLGMLILAGILAGTTWVLCFDRGLYPAETCAARYIMTIAAALIIYFLKVNDRMPKVRSVATHLLVLIALGIASVPVTLCLVKAGAFQQFSKRPLFAVFGLGVLAYLIFLYCKKLLPEALLLAMIVFVIGSVYALSYPAGAGVSWDDHTHYRNILQLSHLNDSDVAKADRSIIKKAKKENNIIQVLWEGKTGRYEKRINREYKEGKIVHRDPAGYIMGQYVVYLPETITLFLARGTGIRYTFVYILGRWIGVLFYAVFLYLALRRLKSGRLIFFVISMIPTMLFLMSNYSYDTWAICISMLAFACFLEIMQDENRKMQMKDIVKICILFALAYIVKPNYFCMILALLFIDKDKLDSSLSRKKYNAVIIITCLLLAATFVIPYLVAGTGGNDMRGGADVNSAEQIKFILTNPVKYTGILLSFLKTFWSPMLSINYICFFAFLGFGKYYIPFFWFLIVIALLDKQKEDLPVIKAGNRVWALLLAFAASCLFTTFLYIAYTAVGSETIEGVQGRYIFPLLMFIGYYIGDYRLAAPFRKVISQHALVLTSSAVTIVYAYYCLYTLVLRFY